MKNHILPFILLFLFASTSLVAQPEWQWGQEVFFNAKHIAVDKFGNSYVSWTLQDPYEIDGELFISNGPADAALTSFDCNGNHRWTKIIGGSGIDEIWGLGTDTLDGVYLAMHVNTTRLPNYNLNFDSDTTVNSQNKGYLLLKYDIEGEYQWHRLPEDSVVLNPPNILIGIAFDMDVAPNGDCFVYSRLFPGTYGGGNFEAIYPSSQQSGREDIYALKYDGDGNFTGGLHFDMWYSGNSVLIRPGFARDHYTGKFYLSGYLSGSNASIIFGGEEVTANNYVVQFDSNGFVNWRISADDTGIGHTYFVGKPAVDEFGNVYVAGDSYNENSFGGFEFNNTINTANFPIIAKIDSAGNVVFATNASVPGVGKGKAIAYSNNQLALTGSYPSHMQWGDINHNNSENNQLTNVFIALFDPTGNGQPTDVSVLYGSANSNEYPHLLVADHQGNFYVGGNFSGQLHVGDGTLYNQSGTQEGFIAKFGTDSCYCPLPTALFTYDSIPNQPGYNFAFTGSADADSVMWDFGDGQTGVGFNPYHLFAETDTYTVCATAYNECGESTICMEINALGPLGLNAINGFENVKVYPNPAQESLFIDNALPGTRIEVFNIVGQKLHATILQSSPGKMDINSFPSGVYLLQLTDKLGNQGYAKFVKE